MNKNKNYHHGDLKEALLRSAEAILVREGAEKLTLRACARDAGVSHAAPAHHFGNLAGLLTALAVTGFLRLAACQEREIEAAGTDPAARKRAVGVGYIRFALFNRALFEFIFKDGRIDRHSPAYGEAVKAAGAPVRRFLGFGEVGALDRDNIEWVRAWSLVHGFAVLATGGALHPPGGGKLGGEELLALGARVLGG